MKGISEAYLGFETTGLSCHYAGITVVGICLVNGVDDRLVQLVGMDVTAVSRAKHLLYVLRSGGERGEYTAS